MMNNHRRNPLRLLGGTAAIALLAGVTAMLGAPGIAHPHPQGEPGQHRERIIIMNQKADGAGEGQGAAQSFELRRGENGEVVLPDCPEGDATRVEEGSGTEHTRVVLCTRGGGAPAERADHLQRARDRLACDSELSEAQRARVTAALDREIARLRGQ